MTIEDISVMLKDAEAYRDIKLLELQRTDQYIIELKRQLWWLEHPQIASFTARTWWETNYAHSEWEQELCFCVYTATGLDGEEMVDVLHTPSYFIHFPPLEEEVVDDYEGAPKTYRNPFLCT